ncbi:MAG: peptidoglycan editing factor PgeF [Lachnospiraceae bacterium]|nr:peptidoglycan editing factor PgeF [Lachnospiraceae bacterium]
MDGYRITEPLSDGVKVVQFPELLQFPELRHGFSTREGGVSSGIFASMNLGFERGDEEANVRENFRRIMTALDIPQGAEVFTKQTHTTNVVVVTAENRGTGIERPVPYDDVDGIVTDVPGLALTVFCSDCVPIWFYDPVRRAIGVCHAGWRGTVGGIAGKTVELMKEQYSCNPTDIHTAIGPSIGPECFEVGEEVAVVFEERFGASVVVREGYPKPHVDLWKANAAVLAEAGVPRDQIAISGLCTMCHPDLLFSHRATGGKRGSNAGFLMLSESDS